MLCVSERVFPQKFHAYMQRAYAVIENFKLFHYMLLSCFLHVNDKSTTKRV